MNLLYPENQLDLNVNEIVLGLVYILTTFHVQVLRASIPRRIICGKHTPFDYGFHMHNL